MCVCVLLFYLFKKKYEVFEVNYWLKCEISRQIWIYSRLTVQQAVVLLVDYIGGGGGGGNYNSINVPISTEGSGTPTMRQKTGFPF